jgi:HEAT repeat protein
MNVRRTNNQAGAENHPQLQRDPFQRTKPLHIGLKVTILMSFVLGMLSLVFYWPKTEPQFDGKRLFVWIQDLEWVTSNLDSDTKRARHEAAANAIRQMGPEVVPLLLSRLRAEDSKWEGIRQHWARSLSIDRAPIREENARIFAAIEAAGNEARGSIQDMMRLLESGKVAAIAIVLSDTFGEEALPYLVKGMTNSAPRVRAASITAIRKLGAKAKGASGLVVVALSDPDTEVRVQ